MDALFGILILGFILYSGVYILYFFIRAFLPSSSQKKYSSQGTKNKGQQQRTTRRNVAPTYSSDRNIKTSQTRNAGKQETKTAWKSLTSEIKEIMNEMDGEPTKKSSSQRRTSAQPVKRNERPQRPVVDSTSTEGWGTEGSYYGREGRGSTEGRSFSREGRGSTEGTGSREGTASYEGTEFHPQGHSMRKRTSIASSPTRKKNSKNPSSIPNLQKNIVHAVIYKEILDQPRSRRPIR